MGDIFVKIAGFICIIALGAIARRVGLVRREDGITICNIVMNVTLPCSLVAGMSGSEIGPSVAVVFLLGLVSSIVLIAVGYLRSRGHGPRIRALEMINSGGYNMGNFGIPFVSGFFPPSMLPFLCMFDAGAAVMTLGGTVSLARNVLSPGSRFSLRGFLSVLFHSIAFDTYVVLMALSIAGIALPAPVVTITGMIGGSNSFLAMFMIGIMLDLHFDADDLGSIVRILSTRYIVTPLIALAFYQVAVIPEMARQVIALALLSPFANVNTLFSAELNLGERVPAAVTTLSILISTALMSGLTVWFLG